MARGISGVSIRTIAEEAHLSSGSLRHVFPSKSDLLVFAMQLVDQRAGKRIEAHLGEPDPRTLALGVLRELLPIDVQRRAEMEVNVALFTEAAGDPQIRRARDEAYDTLRRVVVTLVTHLRDRGFTDPNLDIAETATTVHALVDGLALHLLVASDPAFHEQAVRSLERAVDALHSDPGVSGHPGHVTTAASSSQSLGTA